MKKQLELHGALGIWWFFGGILSAWKMLSLSAHVPDQPSIPSHSF